MSSSNDTLCILIVEEKTEKTLRFSTENVDSLGKPVKIDIP